MPESTLVWSCLHPEWERFLTKPEGSWGSSQSGAASREIVVMALAISLIQIWWIWEPPGFKQMISYTSTYWKSSLIIINHNLNLSVYPYFPCTKTWFSFGATDITHRDGRRGSGKGPVGSCMRRMRCPR